MSRIALSAAILGFSAASAFAAPQPLGLVQTLDPAPLVCDAKGKCAAILASFCLQQSRLAPGPGDRYVAADNAQITLRVTRTNGTVETLDGAKALNFVSYTGFATTTVEIDRARLPADLAGAVVEVGPLATLLPVTAPDDPSPLSAEEIAMATGDWRRQAEALFDKPNMRSDATRLVARAVSVLPESYRQDTAAGHRAAWDAAMAAPGQMFTVEGVQLGRQMFQACKTTVDQSLKWALRKCLENRLDEKQKEINQDYWDQQGGV
ncbi:MAG: hypothetical protein JNM30_02405 [Rhodospirillales bacterium]|nr:hypothetical protein [Rhodospirillales bacterium]